MKLSEPRDFLRSLFDVAVKAADPALSLAAHLPSPPENGRTVVIGAGKGSAQMARALEDLWPGPLTGTVVTRYGYGCATRSIDVLEASHPVPDEAGITAAQRLLDTIASLSENDLVIALICGGGSALLPAAPSGFTLEDEIELNSTLLASGAPISAMNAVRKHFSRIKGGRLAAVTKAKVVSLVISDIPGDNPALISSGPTIPDRTTRHDALRVIKQYSLAIPDRVLDFIGSSDADAPQPENPIFSRNHHQVIASARVSLGAAAVLARSSGIEAHILSDAIEGEARDVAAVHGAIAAEIARRNQPFASACVLLSGGETTVTVRSKGGRGGRNGEFALALSPWIDGLDVHALVADTDGIDGSEENAGAFIDGTSARRILENGMDVRDMLSRHDSYSVFSMLNDLFVTGPTGTNVNDFRAILILPHQR